MLGTRKYAEAIASRKTLDPANFKFETEYYVGPNPDVCDMVEANFPADMSAEAIHDLGRCDHCGTPHHWGAIFRDKTTGELLAVGQDCGGQFFTFASKRAWATAQAAKMKKAREAREAALKAREEYLARHPEMAEALKTDHHIVADINAKLTKWGKLSDAQAELVLKIAREVAEREAAKANEPEPQPIPADVLDGRQRITGVVLGFKDRETQWGWTTKMLVLDDRGFKVWGTAPDGIIGKKSHVTFMARVEKSKDDPCFGFYSRPTKFEVLSTADED